MYLFSCPVHVPFPEPTEKPKTQLEPVKVEPRETKDGGVAGGGKWKGKKKKRSKKRSTILIIENGQNVWSKSSKGAILGY